MKELSDRENLSKNNSDWPFTESEIKLLSNCRLCPRNCGVDRFKLANGYCRSDSEFRISSICIHKGEEPVISGEKGICNVFFPHCNLQCIYCQNAEISQNSKISLPGPIGFDDLIKKICSVLDKTENIVGFVSPSHYVPQMLAIIRGLKDAGRNPKFVYNSNGYEKIETIKMLDGIIDVYLPDFKYMDKIVAFEYSRARDYPKVASAAIKEMYYQKGSALHFDDRGIAESGLIIRHLVLPGLVKQSIEVLKFIAEEISISLNLSLMSQYYPTDSVKNHKNLNRVLKPEEYQTVVDAFHELGFYRGWIQETESNATYRPDFSKDEPFENNVKTAGQTM